MPGRTRQGQQARPAELLLPSEHPLSVPMETPRIPAAGAAQVLSALTHLPALLAALLPSHAQICRCGRDPQPLCQPRPSSLIHHCRELPLQTCKIPSPQLSVGPNSLFAAADHVENNIPWWVTGPHLYSTSVVVLNPGSQRQQGSRHSWGGPGLTGRPQAMCQGGCVRAPGPWWLVKRCCCASQLPLLLLKPGRLERQPLKICFKIACASKCD